MADLRIVKWLGRPTVWVGGISVVALVAMITPTLRVGRPIADDYCGYISTSPSTIFQFTIETYQSFMANVVGFGLYEIFSNVGLLLGPSFALQIFWICTVLAIAATAISITYFLSSRRALIEKGPAVALTVAMTVLLTLGLFVTSPTGSIANLSLGTLTTTTGIFHLWPPLLGGAILFIALCDPFRGLGKAQFFLLLGSTAAVVLMGHAESIAFLALVFASWFLANLVNGFRVLRSWSTINATGLGGVIGLLGLLLSQGSKSPLAVLLGSSQNEPGEVETISATNNSIGSFAIYLVSFAQDSLGRAFGHGFLVLICAMALLSGYLLLRSPQIGTRVAVAAGLTIASLPVTVLVTAMGEYFGYPAWYHEIILNVIAVVLAILLGLLVGASLPRPKHSVGNMAKSPSRLVRLVDPMAVAAFGVLTLIGVAAFLSRVEYLQDRADRWDDGYFTTILNPLDGTLVLPDGDSGLPWVAQCARDFAELKNLEFKNYNPPMS